MWLYLIGCPMLLFLGTLGNGLSFFVLTATRKIRLSAFGMYLSTLAVFDTLALWVTLPRHFIKWLWLKDIRELSEWSCRIFRFLQFSLMNTSAWLLVAVTAERCLSIYFPTKVRYYNSINRTRIIISTICIVHFLWNVHIFWTLGPQYDKTGTKVTSYCGFPDASSAFYWKKVHTWVDMTKLSLLPFLLMVLMNACIVISLKRRADDCRNKKGILNEANVGSNSAPSMAEKQARAASSKTAMLLPVSIFFLIATAPTFVQTAYSNVHADDSKSEHTKAVSLLIDCLSTLMLYSNNAGNFILYCVSGATFRKLCASKLRSICCNRENNDTIDEYTVETQVNGTTSQGLQSSAPSVRLLLASRQRQSTRATPSKPPANGCSYRNESVALLAPTFASA